MCQDNTFTLPYNFVPLATTVHYPEWQDLNQDTPHERGVSGVINITLQNKGSLIIGDEKREGDSVQPFFQIDNKPAIPGSSIKGMIRSIVELATNSHLAIDNNQFSQRDLTNAKNEYMVAIKKRKSGWLTWTEGTNGENGVWIISPCQSKTIRHTSETNHNEKSTNTDVGQVLTDVITLNPPMQNIELATDRYDAIIQAKPNNNRYGPCVEILQDQYLVVTSQLEGSSKKREFLFERPKNKQGYSVPSKVIFAFEKIMDESQTEVGSAHWQAMKKFQAEGIPVFYLLDKEKNITSFGLPGLYRLAYEKTLHELLPLSQQKNATKASLDFSELLFGDIPKDKQETHATKGRVNVSLARINTQIVKFETLDILLASPKPSFYPAYLNQPKGGQATYNTAKGIRGAKVYLPHEKITKTPPPTDSEGNPNLEVMSTVQVLTSNNTFSAKIRVHNVLPEEIGALIWALTLGDLSKESKYIHLLGMGKSLGYGKTKITISSLDLTVNSGSKTDSEQGYLNQFYSYLGQHNMLATQTMVGLQLAHSSNLFTDADLVHPTLNLKTKKDDFKDIRQRKQALINLLDKDHNGQLMSTLQAIEEALKAEIETRQEAHRIQQAKNKQQALQKQQQAEQAQKDEAEQQKRNNRNPLEVLLEDTLGNKLGSKQLKIINEDTQLWAGLSEDYKILLGQKISLGEFYKKKKRKGISAKFTNLLEPVDLFINSQKKK